MSSVEFKLSGRQSPSVRTYLPIVFIMASLVFVPACRDRRANETHTSQAERSSVTTPPDTTPEAAKRAPPILDLMETPGQDGVHHVDVRVRSSHDGSMIDGARIHGNANSAGEHTVLCNDDGEAVTILPSGSSVYLRVSAQGHVPGPWVAFQAPKRPATSALTFTLEAGCSLRVLVVNADTTRPLPGATVRIGIQQAWVTGRSAVWTNLGATSDDGSVSTDVAPLGRTFSVAASMPGFVPHVQPVAVDLDHTRVSVALEPAWSVEGRVTGPDGNPVRGATVVAVAGEAGASDLEYAAQALTDGLNSGWSGARSRTGPDGRFVLEGNQPPPAARRAG